MKKMISICIAYYNRKQHLLKTLETISQSSVKNYEIIVVDDASNENNKLSHEILKPFIDLGINIKLISITPTMKWWKNPCIPYNKAFREARGDKIIIQNPECLHLGDILKDVEDNLTDGNWSAYQTFSLNPDSTQKIQKMKTINLIKGYLDPIMKDAIGDDGYSDKNGWYIHPIHRPGFLHFCVAITKNDLEKLGGFDERFAFDAAFDDNEIIERAKRANLELSIITRCTVVHQYHDNEIKENTPYKGSLNASLFNIIKHENIIRTKKLIEDVILYCKSYRGDIERVKILLSSIQKNNIDNIPFYISVPKSDFPIFLEQLRSQFYFNLIADEEITGVDYQQTWFSQQLVKMQFWKLGVCKNYICIDSDSYFIRKFYKTDFLVDGNPDVPYTVMHEQKELYSWWTLNKQHFHFDARKSFVEDRTKIQNFFQRRGRIYDFLPSPTIWHSKVWEIFEDKYLKPNGISFEKLINFCPSEFTWYGEALLYFRPIQIWPIEPMFKVFHYAKQYIEAKEANITEEQWAENYMGVVIQSNWHNHPSPLKY